MQNTFCDIRNSLEMVLSPNKILWQIQVRKIVGTLLQNFLFVENYLFKTIFLKQTLSDVHVKREKPNIFQKIPQNQSSDVFKSGEHKSDN